MTTCFYTSIGGRVTLGQGTEKYRLWHLSRSENRNPAHCHTGTYCHMLCGIVTCSVVLSHALWYCHMLCGIVTCSVVLSHALWYCHMLCGIVTCSVVLSHALWYVHIAYFNRNTVRGLCIAVLTTMTFVWNESANTKTHGKL